MSYPFVSRSLAACLAPSAASAGSRTRTATKLATPLTALLLLCGSAPGFAQAAGHAKAVLHTSIMQRSSVPPGSVQMHRPPMSAMQPNLTPVNTGPGIVFTCATGVATSTCNYLNTTVAGYYNATFTNANANILVQYGPTGLGSSEYYYNFVTYSQYAAAYGNIPNKSAIQTSAQSALSTYDATPYGADQIWVTAALGTAFGFPGMTGINGDEGSCSIGTAQCYNGVITVTDDSSILYYDDQGGSEPAGSYDFYAVVEHETDEVLGTASCVTTQTNPLSDACDQATGNTGGPSAVDLFRYSSAGNLVLDSSLSTTPGAYFSYDGGTTDGAKGTGGTAKYYNTLDNGDDYADYVASSPDCGTNQAIQDATGCPGEDAGLTILNDGGSEVNILTAVGYSVPATTSACSTGNPNPNPNPAASTVPSDFNGDCKSDILWRNSSSGQAYTWFMNGTALSSSSSSGTAASPWAIQGIGDFDGDGKADILWRNTSTGQVYIWLMNGSTLVSAASPGTVATAWVIEGVGDFNGDGKSDILWQNTSTGQVYVWLMNGAALASSGSPGTIGSPWAIKGVGDFNGDGKADILWQSTTTGQVYIWLMNGTALSSAASPGTVGSPWTIKGVADYNGDGKADILWQSSSTGQVYVWLMNGTTLSTSGTPGTAAAPWQIITP